MLHIIMKYKKELMCQKNGQLVLQISRGMSFKKDPQYQYIEKSHTPTMHFQASLPRLPIPNLEATCRRYLNAQKPLLTGENFEKTTIYVNEFLSKSGNPLQRALIERDTLNYHTSYISEPWFDMYLRDRKPLPINYNPFIVLEPASNPKYNMQIVKATNLVISSLRFMKSLNDNVLRPEIFYTRSETSHNKLFHMITRTLPTKFSWYGAYLFGAYPLDMSQYSNLFNTTRIPKPEKDEIYRSSFARHIVVMRNGHLYSVDVMDKEGCIYTPSSIAASLKFILEDDIMDNKNPLGILTTLNRDTWADTRTYLEQIGNTRTLQIIDSAIFMLILDNTNINSNYNKLIETYLHSDGTNRWFDKSFSLIITKDGYAGVNFEHSWGDGVAVLRYLESIHKDTIYQPMFSPDDVDNLQRTSGTTDVNELEFVVDHKIENIINVQKKTFEKLTGELSIDYIIFNEFGKNECKKFGLSADSVMQLAFQLALYYKRNSIASTYESCSTAAFKHGRTETLRSCTLETKKACEIIAQSNNKLSMSDMKNLLIDCSKVHNQLTKEAVMGQGFDRHLYVLKKISELTNSPKPAIFEDPAYSNINHNILSTSTLSNPIILAGGFGPVVNDGYGIGYSIQDERLGAVVTSYKSSCNANEYVSCLEEAFRSIHQIMIYGK